ncbi:MAG: hypothetical protein ACK5XV_07510 [Flavobacteriales bacterium]|jgi:hypothetical protein
MKSRKTTPPLRKCKIRISLNKFESIRMSIPVYGFETFVHSLN